MIINKQKTKVISFKKSKKLDFPPEMMFSDGTHIECVPSVRLVGVILSQDLKWSENTRYICAKARRKLWILRRMQALDLNEFQLFDVYMKEIRSILEMAVPAWHSSLTKMQSKEIENVQKLALKIILQRRYVSYDLACKTFNTTTLEERRTQLCFRFAMRNLKSDHSYFTQHPQNMKTRNQSSFKVKEIKCNFDRYRKSSIPYLARLLNTYKKS